MAEHMEIRHYCGNEVYREIVRKDLIRCVYMVFPEQKEIAYTIEYDKNGEKTYTRHERFENEVECLRRYNEVLRELTSGKTMSLYYRPIGVEDKEENT